MRHTWGTVGSCMELHGCIISGCGGREGRAAVFDANQIVTFISFNGIVHVGPRRSGKLVVYGSFKKIIIKAVKMW